MDLSRNGVTGLCVETGEAWAVGTCHGASALVRMVSNVGFWSRRPILHKGVSAYVWDASRVLDSGEPVR
jgi:hypothetical protein